MKIVEEFFHYNVFYYGVEKEREISYKFNDYQKQFCMAEALKDIDQENNGTIKIMMDGYQKCFADLHNKYLDPLYQQKNKFYEETNDCFSKAWEAKDMAKVVHGT